MEDRRLDAFARLDLRFDAERAWSEIEPCAGAWKNHPQGFEHNDALLLVSHLGDPRDDSFRHPMRPTPALRRMPYVLEILAALGPPVGRTRLMRLAAGASVPEHVDLHAYWQWRLRLHLPIRTEEGVRFYCGYESVHMKAGEVWTVDTWRPHAVEHEGRSDRIHLVTDVVAVSDGCRLYPMRSRSIGVESDLWEDNDVPVTADALDVATMRIINDVAFGAPDDVRRVGGLCRNFVAVWRASSVLASAASRRARRRHATQTLSARLADHEGQLRLHNGLDAVEVLRERVVRYASTAFTRSVRQVASRPPLDAIVVLSPPRSGSTMVFDALSLSPGVMTIGGESHKLLERSLGLRPTEARNSNVITAEDVGPARINDTREAFYFSARDRSGQSPAYGDRVRLLEKTPKNILRVPFLHRVFPDARWVVVYRRPEEVIASMLEGWHSRRFVTYPEVRLTSGQPWSFLLPPGWLGQLARPLEQVVSWQWAQGVQTLMASLRALPSHRVTWVSYRRLTDAPGAELAMLCQRLDLDGPPEGVPSSLPLASSTVSPPSASKWRQFASELDRSADQWSGTAADWNAMAANQGIDDAG